VLYRQHERLELKQLANDAYVWLFEEEPGHPQHEERRTSMLEVKREDGTTELVKGGRMITSFLSICDMVGMSPKVVRERARSMTAKSIMHAGRPAESRNRERESSGIEEHGVSVDYDYSSESYGSSGVSPDDYVPYTPDYM
jgi:hypothetical protein